MHYYYQRWAIDIFHCKAFCEIPDKKNNRRLVSVILEQFKKKIVQGQMNEKYYVISG